MGSHSVMTSLVLKLVDLAEGASVRGMMKPDGVPAFSVYDFMKITCGYKDTGATARKEWMRLIGRNSEFKDELVAILHFCKFPEAGSRVTPCMTIQGLQRFLVILGGRVTAELRAVVEGVLSRVVAGDQEVHAPDAPAQQGLCASPSHEPVAPVLGELCLGKKREREALLFDMEMAGRRLALEERRRLHVSKLIQDATFAMGAINALRGLVNVDENTKLQAEDHIKNALFNRGADVPEA